MRSLLLGELTAEQAQEQEGLSDIQLTDLIRRHRRAVRRAIDEQIAGALTTQGLAKEDFVLSGNLESMGLMDLLQTIQMGGKNAHIRIEHGGAISELWCADGEVLDAQSGKLVGSLAVYRMLALREGRLQAEFSGVARERTILASTEALLMESARRVDECNLLRQQIGDTQRLCVSSRAGAVEPDTLQREILQAFDGTHSIDDVIADSASSELDTLRAIAWLFKTGALISRSAPDPQGAAVRSAATTDPAVNLVAQPGYASVLPANAGRASQISVPAVAPSITALRQAPEVWRRQWLYAAGGALLLSSFAAGLWSGRAARSGLAQAPTQQPALARLAAALCGPGMQIFTPDSSLNDSPAQQPFCMAERGVSTREYQECVNGHGCEPLLADAARGAEHPGAPQALHCHAGQPGSEQLPLNCINQHQAERYCAWQGQRLPTPGEWEWAWQLHQGRADPSSQIGALSEWTRDRATQPHPGASHGDERPTYAILGAATPRDSATSELRPTRLYTSANVQARDIGFRCALGLEAIGAPPDRAGADAVGFAPAREAEQAAGATRVVAPPE